VALIVSGRSVHHRISIFVAHAFGEPKRRAGFMYGLFLSWIGVIIVALLPPVPEMTLEQLEKRRKGLPPKIYEEAKAELTAARVHRECLFAGRRCGARVPSIHSGATRTRAKRRRFAP
jgi:hypothetical protein